LLQGPADSSVGRASPGAPGLTAKS